MLILNSNNFDLFINSNPVALVDFSANWCRPCQMLIPILDNLSKKGYNVGKVDVDQSPELSQQFNVSHLPTILIFKNGQPVFKKVGLMQEKDLIQILEQ